MLTAVIEALIKGLIVITDKRQMNHGGLKPVQVEKQHILSRKNIIFSKEDWLRIIRHVLAHRQRNGEANMPKPQSESRTNASKHYAAWMFGQLFWSEEWSHFLNQFILISCSLFSFKSHFQNMRVSFILKPALHIFSSWSSL